LQFIEQPVHAVWLDLGNGDLVDIRRATVAAHLTHARSKTSLRWTLS